MARGKNEGSIYKQADGLWACSITLPTRIDGKRRRKVIRSKDKATVVRKLRDLNKQLAQHGDLPTGSMTLEKWITKWRDEIAPQSIRPKTLAGYRTVIDGHIIPELGKVRLEGLTAEHVRRLHKRIQTMPKDPALRGVTPLPEGTELLSSTYALLAHNVLSAALKAAHREGRIPVNPCEMVDKPRKRVTEQKALDVDQAIRMLAYCATIPNGPLWATYLLTGARRGEILGLEADRVTDELDLSWQLQRITDISKAPSDYEYRPLGSTLYLTRPKSSSGWRIVPLVPPLRDILKLAVAGRTEGLVFTENGKPWDPDRATKQWKAALAEAGLPSGVVLHGLRHTAVDLMYEAGVPEAVIMEIVGHSSRTVTRGYKSRGSRPQLTDAMTKMSALLERKTEG